MASTRAVFQIGDNFPYLRVQFGEGLTVASYVPWVIPTGATVTIVITGVDGLEYSGEETCVIEDAAQGIVYYDRSGNEKLTAGEYLYKFKVTLLSGAQRTFPSDGFISVTMLGDKG